MLRINLLPAYIAERRRVRLAIISCAAIFLLVTGGGLAYVFGSLNPSVASKRAEATQEQAVAAQEVAYEQQTATILAQVGPIKDKVDFVDKVRFHNRIRQKIFRNAARYTYRHVEYNAMSVTGDNLALSATVSSLDDIGRFYLLMFANPDVTAVSIAGVPDAATVQANQPVIIPGGAPPAPPQYHIAMNATLVQPVVTPTLPASLGASGATGGGGGGFGGAPGMPPGGPPPGMNGPGMAPNPMGSGAMGGGGGAGGAPPSGGPGPRGSGG